MSLAQETLADASLPDIWMRERSHQFGAAEFGKIHLCVGPAWHRRSFLLADINNAPNATMFPVHSFGVGVRVLVARIPVAQSMIQIAPSGPVCVLTGMNQPSFARTNLDEGGLEARPVGS
jgi:hypothetical protein